MATKGTGSGVLLAVALALAVQIPTSVALIPDALIRSMVQGFLLLAVVVCAVLVRPREVATMVINSLRPPPRQDAPDERVSIRPPPMLPFDVDVDDELDELDERVAQRRDTPRETPAGRRPKR
jgi:hypothetical protein